MVASTIPTRPSGEHTTSLPRTACSHDLSACASLPDRQGPCSVWIFHAALEPIKGRQKPLNGQMGGTPPGRRWRTRWLPCLRGVESVQQQAEHPLQAVQLKRFGHNRVGIYVCCCPLACGVQQQHRWGQCCWAAASACKAAINSTSGRRRSPGEQPVTVPRSVRGGRIPYRALGPANKQQGEGERSLASANEQCQAPCSSLAPMRLGGRAQDVVVLHSP